LFQLISAQAEDEIGSYSPISLLDFVLQSFYSTLCLYDLYFIYFISGWHGLSEAKCVVFFGYFGHCAYQYV